MIESSDAALLEPAWSGAHELPDINFCALSTWILSCKVCVYTSELSPQPLGANWHMVVEQPLEEC